MNDSNYVWWLLFLLASLMSSEKGDLNLEPTNNITEKEKDRDEEYYRLGACKRAIDDNRFSLKLGHVPMLKKKGNTLRCRGYIYGMNEEVCNDCKRCSIQYGHPFDGYWNTKDPNDEIFIDESYKALDEHFQSLTNNMFNDLNRMLYSKGD